MELLRGRVKAPYGLQPYLQAVQPVVAAPRQVGDRQNPSGSSQLPIMPSNFSAASVCSDWITCE